MAIHLKLTTVKKQLQNNKKRILKLWICKLSMKQVKRQILRQNVNRSSHIRAKKKNMKLMIIVIWVGMTALMSIYENNKIMMKTSHEILQMKALVKCKLRLAGKVFKKFKQPSKVERKFNNWQTVLIKISCKKINLFHSRCKSMFQCHFQMISQQQSKWIIILFNKKLLLLNNRLRILYCDSLKHI